MRQKKKRTLWLLAALVVGSLMFAYGMHLASWRSSQYDNYNMGLRAYETGDAKTAVQLFDRSLGSYRGEQRAGWLHRFIYPAPDRELAALANFHKGKALLRARQIEPAVEAFKESLRLNPGNNYGGIGLSEAQRLEAQAEVVKYDLELLFKNNKQQADGQGKGKGKPGDKPGGKPVPGDEPGNMPGKGNKDDI